MRRSLVLALLVAIPATADATPLLQAELSLRSLFHRAVATLAQDPIPDLAILTTEPVARTESSGFGWRKDPIRKRPKFHTGTDYRGKRGTEVVAAGNGLVTFAGRRGGYGRLVIVDHGGGVVTRYAHLQRIEIKRGSVVAAGDRLGQLGSSGRTTGPHLHFEVRLEGRPVDPNTALIVGEITRENPAAGRLAAFALAPELQALAQDAHDPAVPRGPRRAKRPQLLW